MPVRVKRELPACSIDPIINAIKHCRAATLSLSAWCDFWQGKTTLRPQQHLSYHLDPEDSRMFGSLKRARKAITRAGKLIFEESNVELFCQEFGGLIQQLQPIFKKKCLSRHSDEDVEVLNAVDDRREKFLSAYKRNKPLERVLDALSDFIGVSGALNAVIQRRESIVDGREPDELYPPVEIGKYAKAFIQMADQNNGILIYKNHKIGLFYINRAAKNAWKYLRLLLATTDKGGWVFIAENVRQGFGRTTSGNDSDTSSDVVKLNRYIHCRKRGHTSNHEWKISTEQYAKTEHVE